MTWLQLTIASTVVLVGVGAVLLQLASLPGTWIILFLAVGVRALESFYPLGPEPLLSWWTIVGIAGCAVVAEIIELIAAALGAKGGGASKRGMTGALVGSLLGALLGTFLILIPVIGSLVGALVGAMLGAVVGELSVGGKTLRDTAKPAAGAVLGRLLGVLAKTAVAAVMVVVLGIAAFL